MTVADRTWLVLLRDISHAVRIADEPRIVASLVFHMETGIVLASAVAAGEEQVLEQVCQMALSKPAGGLAPRRPDRVLCNPGLARLLETQLRRLARSDPAPPVSEVPAVHEAEDIFDSFVGHLAGRRDADGFAAPSAWQLLFDEVIRFYEREVWSRWADDVDLLIEVGLGEHDATYSAVVLGHEGIQRGVVLYPGTGPPAGLREDRAGRLAAMPPGTLMLNFDPPREVPAEFVLKASRYGWSADADLTPVFLRVDGREPVEPGREDVRVLTVALAALLEHDATGPIPVANGPLVTNGKLSLLEGETASFSIRQLPRDEGELTDGVRLHVAGTGLLPPGTHVVMGSAQADGLALLRRDARIHRPLPADSPRPAGAEVAMLIVVTDAAHGDGIAARVAAMDPYGIGVAEAEGHAVVALVGAEGAEILMELPAGHLAVRRFRSRLRSAKGVHAVLVADEGAARGSGTVYGLFECHLPTNPPKRRQAGTAPAQQPRRRGKRS